MSLSLARAVLIPRHVAVQSLRTSSGSAFTATIRDWFFSLSSSVSTIRNGTSVQGIEQSTSLRKGEYSSETRIANGKNHYLDSILYRIATRSIDEMSVLSTLIDSQNELEGGREGKSSILQDLGLWLMSSTLKKRKAKMNKHKLRKRRKKERLKNKK